MWCSAIIVLVPVVVVVVTIVYLQLFLRTPSAALILNSKISSLVNRGLPIIGFRFILLQRQRESEFLNTCLLLEFLCYVFNF